MTDLRDLLLSLDTDPSTADPVRLVRGRLRRRARLQVGAAVLSTVAVVAFAVVVSDGVRPTAAPAEVAVSATPDPAPVAVVPFVKRPYPGCCDTTPPRAVVPTCAFADLVAEAALRQGEPATQLVVTLRNGGSIACDVPFTGQVELLSGTEVVAADGIGSDLTVALPRPPPVEAGGSVVMSGGWRRPCNPVRTADRLRLALTVRQGSPFGEFTVPVSDGLPSACVNDVGGGGGALGLYDYVVLDSLGRRADDPTKSLVPSLVDVPVTVAKGEVLRFGVRLDNPTRGDIALDRKCPIFAVTINRAGDGARPLVDGALNCVDAPAAVPPGRGVVFLLEVPARPSPGEWTLTWTRTDTGTQGLTAPVLVTAANAQKSALEPLTAGACGTAPMDEDARITTGVADGVPIPRCLYAALEQRLTINNVADRAIIATLSTGQTLRVEARSDATFPGTLQELLGRPGRYRIVFGGFNSAELLVER